ncbi:hypothetical protein AURDEDRAFT_167795 [Auricularia subglabra TFB-10046 SS5]|nr:hypothetical protein AURDEDRAFT_167795 [Auricularia subglabra TFB-10046 SS5]
MVSHLDCSSKPVEVPKLSKLLDELRSAVNKGAAGAAPRKPTTRGRNTAEKGTNTNASGKVQSGGTDAEEQPEPQQKRAKRRKLAAVARRPVKAPKSDQAPADADAQTLTKPNGTLVASAVSTPLPPVEQQQHKAPPPVEQQQQSVFLLPPPSSLPSSLKMLLVPPPQGLQRPPTPPPPRPTSPPPVDDAQEQQPVSPRAEQQNLRPLLPAPPLPQPAPPQQ